MTREKYISPARYYVVVTVNPYPGCGFDKPFTGKVGWANTEMEVKAIIAKDRKAMGETLGGLIAPVQTKNRVYRAFRSMGWEEVTL
jgi:hypothetical protein